MTIKGRYWVMFWLLLFLGTSTLVVVRQRVSLDRSRRVSDLRNQVAALEARQAELEQRVRDAASRRVLIPKAESLGLHLPSDSEFVQFLVPGGDR